MKPANGELEKNLYFHHAVEIKQSHAMTGPKELKKYFYSFGKRNFGKKGVNIYMFAPFCFIKIELFY